MSVAQAVVILAKRSSISSAIGSTNRLGEYAASRPVHVQEIIGTAYQNLGIDVMNTTLSDPTGRPQFLVDLREPMRELV